MVNLREIDISLKGHWFYYIRPDFAFQRSIPKEEQQNFKGHNDGILIHKSKEKESEYFTKRYYVFIDDNFYNETIKEIKKVLIRNLIAFIKRYGMLPWKCYITRDTKNSLWIKYEPVKHISFVLIVFPKEDLKKSMNIVHKMETNSSNPLKQTERNEKTIGRIEGEFYIDQIRKQTGGKISIYNATVIAIDKRIDIDDKYGDKRWFYINIEGGEAAISPKKKEQKFKFQAVNIKCSERCMKEYMLEVNDKVSFNGQTKLDHHHGLIIQGIRKFTKVK